MGTARAGAAVEAGAEVGLAAGFQGQAPNLRKTERLFAAPQTFHGRC